ASALGEQGIDARWPGVEPHRFGELTVAQIEHDFDSRRAREHHGPGRDFLPALADILGRHITARRSGAWPDEDALGPRAFGHSRVGPMLEYVEDRRERREVGGVRHLSSLAPMGSRRRRGGDTMLLAHAGTVSGARAERDCPIHAPPMARGSPVSSSVLRLAITAGQPWLMPASTLLPGSKPLWTTVSLTSSPWSSISKLTFERGSDANSLYVASSKPLLFAHSGVNVCHV